MKLTANKIMSSKRLVQVMYTNGKYDYVPEGMLRELQNKKMISYLV